MCLILLVPFVTDTYKSVDWQAVATVGGMMSLGLALEKTGAAGALAHFIVTIFQWAGANWILCALLALTVAPTQLIENPAVAIVLAPIAYQIARESALFGMPCPLPIRPITRLSPLRPSPSLLAPLG
jgi:di/tricarboxylate transporter